MFIDLKFIFLDSGLGNYMAISPKDKLFSKR